MPPSTWLERVLDSLREHGVPERERLRLVDELQDHLTDAQEANMHTNPPRDLENSMGPPGPLAQALADSYRRERFLARHPWLAGALFTLGPVVLHAMLTLYLSCMTLMAFCCTLAPEAIPEFIDAALPIFLATLSVLTGIAVTAWFCLAARRNRLSWWMSLLGCAAVALETPLLNSEFLETSLAFWVGTLSTAAACLATWYVLAWRRQCWKEKPMSLARRYPLMLTGLGSLGAACVCLGTYLTLVAVLIAGIRDFCDVPTINNYLAPMALSCRFVPFAFAAYLCWRMTHRCPRRLLCALAACLGVALVATLFFAEMSIAPSGEASFHFGIAIKVWSGWSLLAQFLTPLAIWGALTLMTRHSWQSRMPGAA